MPFRVVATLSRLAGILVVAAACATDEPTPPSSSGLRVQLGGDAVAVRQGHTAALTARVVDANGRVVAGVPIRWRAIDDGVARVSDGGVVSGDRPGAARVEAYLEGGDGSDTTVVDVFGHPEGLLVDRVALEGAPFGAAVSRQGVAYVTQAGSARVARLSLDPFGVHGGVDVGFVPTGVAFSASGDTAYVTNQLSHNVGIIDVAAGAQTGTVAVSGDPFVATLSPDDRTVYVTQNDQWVFAVDRATHTVRDSIRVGSAPNGFALHPDGTRLYVSAFFGGTITEIDPATDAVLRTFSPGGMPQGMVVSADGKELYSANEAGWLDVYDLASGERAARIATDGGGFGIALSPDEAHVYVSLSNAGTVQVINLAARRVTLTLDVGGRPRRIAFDHHGGNAVVANEAGWVDLVR